MICMKCHSQVVECKCPDAESRLAAVAEMSPEARPAALQNLGARAIKHGIESGRLIQYEEEDFVFLCRVLENKSTPEMTRYRLEVVRVLKESTMFKSTEPGHVFEPASNPQYAHYCGWTITPSDLKE